MFHTYILLHLKHHISSRMLVSSVIRLEGKLVVVVLVPIWSMLKCARGWELDRIHSLAMLLFSNFTGLEITMFWILGDCDSFTLWLT